MNLKVSSSTVRRRLIKNGLTVHLAKKKPQLRPHNIGKRLTWAKNTQLGSVKDWDKVQRSDESTFVIFDKRTHSYVRRRAGEGLHRVCVDKTTKLGEAR